MFVDDVDRAVFRDLLRECALAQHVQIHAYALRDQEVRLLLTPSSADGLSKLIQSIGRRYVARFNRRHARSGSLWEGRFRATVVEPEQHLLSCMLYVEDVNASFQTGDLDLSWTSAPHHLGARADSMVVEPAQYWKLGNTPFEREVAYRHFCQEALTERQVAEITGALNAGWPLGTSEFRQLLESTTTRRLAPLPRGRPRKASVTN